MLRLCSNCYSRWENTRVNDHGLSHPSPLGQQAASFCSSTSANPSELPTNKAGAVSGGDLGHCLQPVRDRTSGFPRHCQERSAGTRSPANLRPGTSQKMAAAVMAASRGHIARPHVWWGLAGLTTACLQSQASSPIGPTPKAEALCITSARLCAGG